MSSKQGYKLKRKLARGGSIFLPALGAGLGGALGAGAGTAASAGLDKALLKKEDEKKAIRKSVKIGLAITAGTGALAALAGTNATASPFESVKKLFGGSTGSPGHEPEGSEPLPAGSGGGLGDIAGKIKDSLSRGGGGAGGDPDSDSMSAGGKPNYLTLGALALVGVGGIWFLTRKRRKSA